MDDHIYIIKFNSKFYQIFGLWRDPDESRAYKIYRLIFHFVFSIIYLGSIVVGSLTALTANTVVDFFSEILYMTLTEAAMTVKVIYGFLNFASIYQLPQKALSNRFQPTTEEERRFSREILKRINTYFTLYLALGAFAVWTGLTCLFDDQYKLPFFPWLLGIPYGKHLPYNYNFLVFYQVTGMFFHAMFNIIADIQVGYLLAVANIQLDFLQRRFRVMCHDQRYFHEQFEQHVNHFEVVNNYVKEVERIYSIPVFCQFCASGITICAIAYRMSSLNLVKDLSTVVPVFLYILAMMNQIFLPCYFGNNVTLQSEQLTHALFSSEWVQMTPKNRKDIMMMMIRTERSITVRAAGFFHYNLNAFTSTLNTAYSLFCVLQQNA